MQKKTLYERDFSAVPPLQNASRLEYVLLEEPEGAMFGVELLHRYEEGVLASCQTLLSESKTHVLKIVQILYENAATEVDALAIASDLLWRLEEEREEG